MCGESKYTLFVSGSGSDSELYVKHGKAGVPFSE